MNLISLIICLVLSGLMLSVGIFYNGSSYTASKNEAKYVKLMNDFSELSQAAQAANAQKHEFSRYVSPTRSLINGGFLSSAPHFDKMTPVESDYNYKLYKNTNYMANDKSSDWTVIKILISDKDLCAKINGFEKIPSLLIEGNGEEGGMNEENQPRGAIVDHIYASGGQLFSFISQPDLTTKTICFRSSDTEMDNEYVVSHIIDISEARRQLSFEINQQEPN